MARVIGYVKSLNQGKFFAKDTNGHIHELKVGDQIHEGELVYGANGNPKIAQIIIDLTLDGISDFMVAGNSALLFDSSIFEGSFTDSDAIIDADSLKNALSFQPSDKAVNLDVLGDETETAAGQEIAEGTRIGDSFDSRTGDLGDVSTHLNNTNYTDNTPNQQDTFRPIILENQETVAPPTSAGTVTLKVVATDASGNILTDGSANAGDEGTNTYYKVIALAPDGVTQISAAGTATVSFTNLGTTTSADYTPSATTINIGTVFNAALIDDYVSDNGEKFEVSLTSNTVTGFEKVVNSTAKVTTTITDETTTSDASKVFAQISVDKASVAEGGVLNYTVSLVDQNGAAVTVPSGQTLTVALNWSGTAASGADTSELPSSVTITNGSTTTFTIDTVNDTFYEDTEPLIATISSVTDVHNTFEKISVGSQNIANSAIIDNDTVAVSNVVSDDDYADENRDTNLLNDIVQIGVIQHVNYTSTVIMSGNSNGVTSNGKAVTYVWNATTKTLTGSSSEGTVFTIKVNSDNTSYTFKQVKALDHLPTVQGESDLKTLNFSLSVDGSSSTPFTVSVFDDAPAVNGTTAINAANKVGQTVLGSLPIELSNDVTDFKWNSTGSTMPTLYANGKVVQLEYSDSGDILSGYIMNGTVRENVFTLKANIATATYEFKTFTELLGGTVNASSFTGITGGNSQSLQIIDNNNNVILINMTGERNGAFAQVNYSAQGISVNGGAGNWIDSDGKEVLTMAFTTDITSATFSLEAQGQTAVMSWEAFRGGVLVASGSNVSIARSTPEQPLTISASQSFDTIKFTSVTGEWRPEITSATYINYQSTINMKTAYSLTDADGDTAAGEISTRLIGRAAPSITTSSAVVSEEGLSGANPDIIGVSDTTNLASFSGSMNISGIGTLSIGLHQPSSVITSNGIALSWSGVGTKTLIGSSGTTEILRITMQDNGDYQIQLSGPVDHSIAGAEDVLTLGFGVTVSDGEISSSAVLTVAIEDDSPVTSAVTQSFIIGQQNTNIMIVLDISGSMTSGTVNRLTAAKTAITNLINTYDGYGDVAVKIVTFSTIASDTSGVWMSAFDALNVLNSITADGWTNYDAALAQAMDSWGAAGKFTVVPTGGKLQNVAYFLSDGQPNENDGNSNLLLNNANGTRGGSDTGIQSAEEAIWKAFLEGNKIKSYAFGMGDGLTASDMVFLDPIAYDGVTKINTSSEWVKDVNDLSSVLESTVVPIASGNILTGATPGSVGADGGYVSVISVGPTGNTRTFTWDKLTDTITASGPGSSSYVFDTSTHVLTITTAQGGKGIVDLDDGNYTYTPPITMTETMTEIFGFTLIDNDGDSSSGEITMNLSRNTGSVTINGTSSNNTLTGGNTDDIISGGAGNDTIYGGAGNDWLSGGSGSDKLFGGAGNDILVTDLQTNSATGTTLSGDTGLGNLDGGTGIDTLMFSNNNSAINFAALDSTNNSIKNIEIIDLGNGGTSDSHFLNNISLQDVIDMTDSTKLLKILGDSSDKVDFSNGSGNDQWSKTANASSEIINGVSHAFDHYTNAKDTSVLVKVEIAIIDTI